MLDDVLSSGGHNLDYVQNSGYCEFFQSIKKICKSDKKLKIDVRNRKLGLLDPVLEPDINLSFFKMLKKMWGNKHYVNFAFLKTPLKQKLSKLVSVPVVRSKIDILMNNDAETACGSLKKGSHGRREYSLVSVRRLPLDYLYLVKCSKVRASVLKSDFESESDSITTNFTSFCLLSKDIEERDLKELIVSSDKLQLNLVVLEMLNALLKVRNLDKIFNKELVSPNDLAMFKWVEYCGKLLDAHVVMSETELRDEFSMKHPTFASIISNSDKSVYLRFSQQLFTNFGNRVRIEDGDDKYLKHICPLFKLYYSDSNVKMFDKECGGHIYIDGTRYGEKNGVKMQLIIIFATLASQNKYIALAFIETKVELNESEYTQLFEVIRKPFNFNHVTTDFEHACLNASRKLNVSIWGCMFHFANRNVRSKAVLYKVPAWIYNNVIKIPFFNREETEHALALLKKLKVTVDNKCISDFLDFVINEYFTYEYFNYSFTSSKELNAIRYMWITNSALESYNHVFKSYAEKCRHQRRISDSFIFKILREQEKGIFLINRGISKYSHDTDYFQQFHNNYNKFKDYIYSDLNIISVSNIAKTGTYKLPFDNITKEDRLQSRKIKVQNERIVRELREHIPTNHMNTQTEILIEPIGTSFNENAINMELENKRLLNKAIVEYSEMGDFTEITKGDDLRPYYRTFVFGGHEFNGHYLISEQRKSEEALEREKIDSFEINNRIIENDQILELFIQNESVSNAKKSEIPDTMDIESDIGLGVNIQQNIQPVIVVGNTPLEFVFGATEQSITDKQKHILRQVLIGHSAAEIDKYFDCKEMTNACILENGKVISTCVIFVSFEQKQAEIIAFGTTMNRQRFGFGSKLLKLIQSHLAVIGVGCVTVLSDKSSVGFYKKCGFQKMAIKSKKVNINYNGNSHLFNINFKRDLSLVCNVQQSFRQNPLNSDKNIINKTKQMGNTVKGYIWRETITMEPEVIKIIPSEIKSEPTVINDPLVIFKRGVLSSGNEHEQKHIDDLNLKRIKTLESDIEKERLRAERERLEKEMALTRANGLERRMRELEEQNRQLSQNQFSGSLKGIFNLRPVWAKKDNSGISNLIPNAVHKKKNK